MARTVLKNAAGNREIVDAKESAVITAVLKDADETPLTKAMIASLTLTLTNSRDGATINDRENQNILDVNDGTVAADGTVTIKLQPADNIVSGSDVDEIEEHLAVLRYTWTDGDGDPMSGAEQWIIEVLASPK